MSELVVQMPTELLNPATGEVLPATPENAAVVLARVRDMRYRLLDAVKACEAVLIEESRRQGTKTLTISGLTASISGGSTVTWDVELLEKGLRAVGCPEERIADLVTETIEYKVNNTVARQLAAANPIYAEAIEAAKTRAESPVRVYVKGDKL